MRSIARHRGGHSGPSATQRRLRSAYNRFADIASDIPESIMALAARAGIAAIFFYSGRTKVDGLLTVNDSAYLLFEEEYRLPLLAPDVAAELATYAEHLFPLLLLVGLFTRLSALALLVMTAVIQLFVYPDAWPTHLSWAAILLYLMVRGPGRLALDRLLGLR